MTDIQQYDLVKYPGGYDQPVMIVLGDGKSHTILRVLRPDGKGELEETYVFRDRMQKIL